MVGQIWGRRPKKEKTLVTDVIILTRGLNASFAEIYAKSKKKDLHLRNIQLPVFNAPLWKNRLFFTTLFSLPFFRRIFQTTSGSLGDPLVSGSPSLYYTNTKYSDIVWFIHDIEHTVVTVCYAAEQTIVAVLDASLLIRSSNFRN